MRFTNFIVLVFFLTLACEAFGQQPGKLRGVVKNQEGKAVEYASIVLEGKNVFTQTNQIGQFELSAPAGDYSVLISAVGYLAHRVKVQIHGKQSRELNIQLEVDPSTNMDQVIVTGKSAIQEVRETPFNVVALDAKSHYNSTLDLAHLLDKASGVKIRESGGVGSDVIMPIKITRTMPIKLKPDCSTA